MKKIYIFIVLIAIAFTPKANADELTTVTDSVLTYEWDNEAWELYESNISLFNEAGEFTGYIDYTAGKTYRYIYTVDANGNETEKIKQNLDSESKEWINYSNYIKTYDANGNTLSYYTAYWDTENNAWYIKEDTKKTITAYDTNNTLTAKKEQHYIGEEWIDTKVWAYTLDTNNLPSEITASELDDSVWVKSSSNAVYEYDSVAHLITETWFKLDDENNYTVKYLQMNYAYNELGQLITESKLKGNSSNEWYIYSYKYTYSYDASGFMTVELREKASSDVYVLYDKTIYTYTENGQLITELNMDANSDKTDFENDEKTTYEYDAQGQITRELDEEWIDGAWAIDADELSEYTYDLNGQFTGITTTKWNDSVYVNVEKSVNFLSSDVAPELTITLPANVDENIVVSTSQAIRFANDTMITDSTFADAFSIYDDDANTVDFTIAIDSLNRMFTLTPAAQFAVNTNYTVAITGIEGLYNNSATDTLSTFVFEDHTGVDTKNSTELSVYPNPASNNLFVKGAGSTVQYTLYNALGKSILTGSFDNDGMIDISAQSNGIYFINVEKEGMSQMQKLIIKK